MHTQFYSFFSFKTVVVQPAGMHHHPPRLCCGCRWDFFKSAYISDPQSRIDAWLMAYRLSVASTPAHPAALLTSSGGGSYGCIPLQSTHPAVSLRSHARDVGGVATAWSRSADAGEVAEEDDSEGQGNAFGSQNSLSG
jgi:hypothetical protein